MRQLLRLSLFALGAAAPLLEPSAQSAPVAPSAYVAAYARLLRAEDQRSFDTVALKSAMAVDDVDLRRAAAMSVARLAPTHRAQALPWLRTGANDPDAAIAAASVFGLGLVRDTTAIEILSGLIAKSGSRGRVQLAVGAAWSLGEIGKPASAAISALLRSFAPSAPSVNGVTPNARVTTALLIAASKIRPIDLLPVRPFLASGVGEARWAAAYAIARQRSPAGASALLAVHGGDAAFRAELARELMFAAVGDSLASAAFARLRLLLNDVDPHVRINAARSLGTFGMRARPLLRASLLDGDANVRIATAQSVATAFARDSASWRDAWRADSSHKFHESLNTAAVAAGYAIPEASDWPGSPEWRLRAAALAAWSGSSDTARARRAAFAALHDADGRVRASAYDVLASSDTARRDSTIQATLRAALSDPDLVAREGLPEFHASPDSSAFRRSADWYAAAVRDVVLPSLKGRSVRARMLTARGEITIALAGSEAPLTVLNFIDLARRGTFDGLRFHRVVPGFVAQGGDPRGDGNGGPGYAIRDELNMLPYSRGAVGMALSGPDTGGSQYFLTLAPQPHLDGHYTVFGSVVSGFSEMDALVEGDLIRSVRILR